MERIQTKIKRDRCPYCHDDIMPGGDNYACHACLAWHHMGCWKEHGACIGCGNAEIKDYTSGSVGTPMPEPTPVDRPWTGASADAAKLRTKLGPNRLTKRKKNRNCALHGHNPTTRKLFGDSTSTKKLFDVCSCGPPMTKVGDEWVDLEAAARHAVHAVALQRAVNISASKDHESIQRAGAGPQKDPHCPHRYRKDTLLCVYCHAEPPTHSAKDEFAEIDKHLSNLRNGKSAPMSVEAFAFACLAVMVSILIAIFG